MGPMRRGGEPEGAMDNARGGDAAAAEARMGGLSGEDSPPSVGGEEDGEPKRFEGDTDFMDDIDKNTRQYFHKIRKDFDRFDRIDFTQTLLFTSAKELEYTKEKKYTVSSGFYLND